MTRSPFGPLDHPHVALVTMLAGAASAAPSPSPGISPGISIGYQYTRFAGPDGREIELAIWYPSDAPATPQPFGPFEQTVAKDGAIAGAGLPLIVISHGTGGSFGGHYDTAHALAWKPGSSSRRCLIPATILRSAATASPGGISSSGRASSARRSITC